MTLINSLSAGIIDINTTLDNNKPKDLLKQLAIEMKVPKVNTIVKSSAPTLQDIIARHIEKDIMRKSNGKI